MQQTEYCSFFATRLISWYTVNKRSLPWRDTPSPYNVWLSEIIMQQTRVSQGLTYYLNILKSFPTVKDLADADEEILLKHWQGLGYYSRAKNLHTTAKTIAYQYGGVFPQEYCSLLKLKGIGDYTASAIASICFNQNHAVVDGNVYRVLARVFGINTPINTKEGIIQFKQLATLLLDKTQPGTYNQAIMEFGALQCKPQKPNCYKCIMNDKCKALGENMVATLPVKIKKIKIRKRFFNYIVLTSTKKNTILQKRIGKDIWQGLYEFPLIETLHQADKKTVENWLKEQNIRYNNLINYYSRPQIYKLSHQHLYCQFWIVETPDRKHKSIDYKDVNTYPLPVPIANFWREFGN